MRLLGCLALALVLALTGCAGSRSEGAAGPSAASGSATHPLTLKQVGGAIDLPTQPQRVFVIDNWGLDLTVALGVKPVGVATYFPPSAWLADAPELQSVQLISVVDAFPMEKIAAARPDLIVDLTGSTLADTGAQRQLKAMAPVLYPPTNAESDTWQDRVRHLGRALGRSADADQVVARGETTVAEVKRRYPRLVGASLTFARMDPPASFAIVAGEDDFTRRYLNTELGFRTPPEQVEAYRQRQFDVAGGVLEGVSLERLDLLDADADAALIWFQEDQNLEALQRQRVWRDVPFVAEGRLVPMDIDAAIAFRTPTPSSLAWAADNLIPQIAAAVDKSGG